jgi:tetratricopeptide (TPR) repeat protein
MAVAAQHLGRVATLAGRIDEAFGHLQEARALFELIGAASDVQEVDVNLAETHLAAGDPARALEIAEANRDAGVVRYAALERIRGQAHAALGNAAAAREALESSLDEARARDALFDVARALDALVDLDVRDGDLLSAEQREREAADLLRRLGVRDLPERRVPAPAGTAGQPAAALA